MTWGAWPWVGREHELGLLQRLLRGGSGAPGILLTGAAGVGKSRLAREALTTAPRIHPEWLLCTEASRAVPLGAFGGVVRDVGSDPLGRVSDIVESLGAAAGANRLVVVVDDAQHLDQLSALVVQQLGTRRRASLVLTARTGEELPDVVHALRKDDLLLQHEVQPLTLAETSSLLAVALGDDVDSTSARRIWTYAQGNVLFLRQLVRDEADAGRLVRRRGLWVWDGEVGITPTLADLVRATVGRQSARVTGVLDVLAACEPLPLGILETLTADGAVDEAEAQGLVVVSAEAAPQVRFAHPLIGEAHRTEASSTTVRRLRGIVADELAKSSGSDPRDVIRRAVLLSDSDRDPGADLLCEATEAALRLSDTSLGIRLARRAVERGGGDRAQLLHATAQGLGFGTEDLQSALAAVTTQDSATAVRVEFIALATTAWTDGRVDSAVARLPAFRDLAVAAGAERVYLAIAASLAGGMGDAEGAVELADAAIADSDLDALATVMALWGRTFGLTDLGRFAEVRATVARSEATCVTYDTASLRYGSRWLWYRALLLAGDLAVAAAELRSETVGPDLTVASAQTAQIAPVQVALYSGDLTVAVRLARELTARGTKQPGADSLVAAWLARAAAQLGDSALAEQASKEMDLRPVPPVWRPEVDVSHAWVLAAAGNLTAALGYLHRTVDPRRPGVEVLLLQTCAQFGDATVAPRLTELAGFVEGPRVRAAAAHASALAHDDGDALLRASAMYQDYGDIVAAADAAVQASTTYTHADHRGAALTAAETAHRLADAAGGTRTPAVRAMTEPVRFTRREREVIALVRQGHSNSDIARALNLSLRTVENHVYRASQKAGARNRAELGALKGGWWR